MDDLCSTCLCSGRNLCLLEDTEYYHMYLQILNESQGLTSQVNVCWECLALLKKVKAFKMKVENAQKILHLSANKQTVLRNNLSNLTLSSIETTTFDLPVLDEEENFLDTLKISESCSDLSKDLKQAEDNLVNFEDSICEIMIEDVRSCREILDGKPVLDWSISSTEVTDKVEPLDSPVDQDQSRYRRWKRSVLLVFKRICSHPHAVHFMRPVTDDIAPHYSNIVRRPTDLTTIRQRIKNRVIRTTTEFTRALLLMFSNALMYNSSHHDIYLMTVEFREETLRYLSLLIEALATAERPHAAPPAPFAAPLHFTRRASVWERPEDDFMKTPAPLRGRRSTLFEPPQNPKPKEHLSNRSTLDRIVPAAVTRPPDHPSQERSSGQIKAPAPLRCRRATVYHPSTEPPAKKRSSDKIKAAPLRTRRATVALQPPTQHPLAKKRSKSPVTVPIVEHSTKKRVTLDKIKAAPLRGRRATLYKPSQPSKSVELPSAGKRSSDRIKAASLRGRRATVYKASKQPPKTVEHPTKSRSLAKTKAPPLRGRRSTVYEASMQSPKPVQHLPAKKGASDQMKAAPLRGRRSTVCKASMQSPKPVQHLSAKKGASDQMKAAPLRGRRSTVYEASMQSPKPVQHLSAKKGASDQMKTAPLRGRRSTVYEASMQSPKPVQHLSAKKGASDQMKAAPLRGRRSTVYEASKQSPKPVQHLSAKKGASDQMKAALLRGRRATAYEVSIQPIQLTEHSYAITLFSDKSKAAPLRGRRSTVYKASTKAPEAVDHSKNRSSDQIKAAPLKTRRATVFTSKQNIQPVKTSKKRPKWDWPSLDDEYLIAKKFKYADADL